MSESVEVLIEQTNESLSQKYNHFYKDIVIEYLPHGENFTVVQVICHDLTIFTDNQPVVQSPLVLATFKVGNDEMKNHYHYMTSYFIDELILACLNKPNIDLLFLHKMDFESALGLPVILCDLFDSDADIYVQQVNTLGVMGRGLAKTIANKYPNVLDDYRTFVKVNPSNLLGRVNWSRQDESSPIIANVFAQQTIKTYSPHIDCHTNYFALLTGLLSVAKGAVRTNRKVAIPYGLGANLAGGDWNFIIWLISFVKNEHPEFDYVICKKPSF